MTWYKTKRLFLNKPYLIDPYRIMSLKKAKAICRKRGYPSDEELLENVRIKMGKTHAQWIDLIGVSKYGRVKAVAELKRLMIRRRKRVIVYVCGALIVSFMSFTSPGRALAVEIFRVVVTVIENILYIRPVGVDPTIDTRIDSDEISLIEQDLDERTISFETVDEIKRYVQKPLLFLDSQDFDIETIQYSETSILEDSVQIEYRSTSSDIRVGIFISWPNNIDAVSKNLNIDGGEYIHTIMDSGIVMEGVITPDRQYMGIATLEDSVIYVNIQLQQDIDESDLKSSAIQILNMLLLL